MPKPKPSWSDKLRHCDAPVIKRLEKSFAGMPEGAQMLIASPAVIDAYLREIPAGRTIRVKTMRDELAARHGAEVTCPVTTGIFLRIAAEAAWERHLAGESLDAITPFWRVIEPDAPLAAKLACGSAFIAEQREKESALLAR